MLAMIELEMKTQAELSAEIAQRMKARRKEVGFTQAQLAERSGVSLGSLKRFEQIHEISLSSLVKICVALGCENDLDGLFSKRQYRSIEEVIADGRRNIR